MKLHSALTSAHRKLSDYYFKVDKSPFYVWASILDPHILYYGLHSDCEDDITTQMHIEKQKNNLHALYKKEYATAVAQIVPSSFPTDAGPLENTGQSPTKFNFTARYKKRSNTSIDEFEQYLKLPQEDFDTCDPILWWAGRRAQFPNLSRLARDILSIPGPTVAVERIFSGGRDTVSMRRASLKPETIRTLMLVKAKLRLARAAIKELN